MVVVVVEVEKVDEEERETVVVVVEVERGKVDEDARKVVVVVEVHALE